MNHLNHYVSYLTRYPRLLASVLLIGAPVANLFYMHWSLSRFVNHGKELKPLTPSIKKTVSSIPEEALSSDHVMFHDWAQRSIPASKVPDLSSDELVILFLRHTMKLFARLPQAYIMKAIASPEQRRTFEPSYINTLDFKVGDVVHAMYRVIARSEGKVEFEMTPLVGVMKGGRLVVTVEKKGDELVCGNETVVWKNAGEKELMHLEKGIVKWFHEIASWRLLRAGTKYLMDLKKKKEKEL
ncbi:hypothetical protein ONS95_001818 [Cadophora gregata]|uniref:uncharacterized protein n=1 Tax=Cadophora gregata TaxID=51156 RepID=UPI0026DD0460|nr:uncharacterized protein ONS95_001818 [Cadophora gregata]KAK0111462.1 hypothetical protein ONS95_001818 [Cadophora gregata]